VVSLGGGALLDPAAQEALAQAGFVVVVLHAPWELVAERIARSDRPLAAEAAHRYEARRQHYATVGHPVDTRGRSPQEVADAVVAVCRRTACSR